MRIHPSRALVLAISLALSACSLTSRPKDGTVEVAWWVNARFEPAAEEIFGIPVRDLDPSWASASLLKDLPLPPAARRWGQSPSAHGMDFEAKADFDEDGRREKAAVGVYRKRDGSEGIFLVVVEPGPSSGWTREALFQYPGAPGFSAISKHDGGLNWMDCMECDSYAVVRWKDGKYTREWQACCEE